MVLGIRYVQKIALEGHALGMVKGRKHKVAVLESWRDAADGLDHLSF